MGQRVIAVVRIAFGLVWAADAILKWYPTFDRQLLGDVRMARVGQPQVVKDWIDLWLHVLQSNPSLFGHLLAILESLLALSMLAGVFTNLACVLGAGLSLLIWTTAEGLGGPYVPGATDVSASIIYILVFALLWATAAGGYWGLDVKLRPRLGRMGWLSSPPSNVVDSVVMTTEEAPPPPSATSPSATPPSAAPLSGTSSPSPTGAWKKRPPGVPGTVPPPSVPLAFLIAASFGLVACGVAWLWARGAAAVDPTSDPVVAAVHFGVLATLATGILGATHQFTTVITARPLRSVALARATFVVWLAASWMLPLGVATEQLAVTAISGALAGVAVVLLVVNLSAPLAVRGKGAPVIALRFALVGAVLTCFLGVVFVFDRTGSWFDLTARVDVAMGVLGLFGWLGTTYVGVAEKLWPMFMLAHLRGGHRAGITASWALPVGAFALAPGIAWSISVLAWAGAAVLALGLAAHVFSLWNHIRHRRRKADLHLVYLLTSAAWLPVGVGLSLAALIVLPRDYHAGIALGAAALVAFGGWILEALVGHAHKVVPFILWSGLRSRGVDKNSGGQPLMFSDLYVHAWAVVAYATVTSGIGALCLGLGASLPTATAFGGGLFIVTGLVLMVNLSWNSLAYLRRNRSASPSSVAASAATPRGPGEEAPRDSGVGALGRHTDRASALSLVALIVAIAALAMGTWAVASSGHRASTTATTSATAGAPVVANGTTKTVNVSLGQFYVRPSTITVAYGTRLVLHVTNDGDMDHNLQLEGESTGTGMLSPGEEKTVDYGVFGRSEQAWCTVPGHKALGMLMNIVVSASPGSAASGNASTGTPSAGASKADATIDPSATPAVGWHAFNPSLAPAPGGTVHHVTLVAEDKLIQVAPGVTQDMWTYNGRVPAPILQGHVGDVFDVTLVNHTDMDHSIDFHAENEPMSNMMDVAPGKSITYQFEAHYSGIFLYHCGTAPVLEHLANGMYGAVIIDPPGLAPVSHQFIMIESELYFGAQGQSGDFSKMLANKPSAYAFDDYVNQFLYSPLHVRAGQQIRVWVLNAGPNDAMSFHVVGAPFTTVYKEGAYLLQPGPLQGASQVLDLSPGQGGFVAFNVPVAGRYEMIDHYLFHAALGAAGYIDASR